MLFVDNQSITKPQMNLALEEFLLREVVIDEPLLLFYINEPSVIIGRNQNTIEEIDADYIADHGINLVRRLSGGGAVYHDLGNLNFSFVTPGKEDLHNFAAFNEPVIRVLRSLGVDAELRGRSDIFADGRKISGNAQYASGGRMFSHGTLLFDTDLGEMLRAINPHGREIESKAVQSVRSYVANIRELLPESMSMEAFRLALLEGIFKDRSIPTYTLTEADWQQVRTIAADRYSVWEWNFGRSPDSNVRKQTQTAAGKIDAHLNIKQGRVDAIRIYGDFNGLRPIADLEAQLAGTPYERQALLATVAQLDLDNFFGQMTNESFIDAIY